MKISGENLINVNYNLIKFEIVLSKYEKGFIKVTP